MDTLADSYRQMQKRPRQRLTDTVQRFLTELQGLAEENLTESDLYESIDSTFRRRLLGGRFRSKREKELVLRILKQLQKILES